MYGKSMATKLLDQLRAAIRSRHYSIRTEQAYTSWVVRYIRFHGMRHPSELAEPEISAFLTHLAVDRDVAANTQNQALSALLFLYKNVLGKPLGAFTNAVRAKKPQKLPVVLSREEVRGIDRRAMDELGMPGTMLMENAGRGAADLLERLGIDGTVVVVAGRGNNGGDGFVLARQLDCRGFPVRVLLLGEAAMLRGETETNWKIIEDAGLPCQQLGGEPSLVEIESIVRDSAWTVDALLGTGTQGELREPVRSVIERLNASANNIFSLDLPSGLDCDTGLPLGPCIKAAHTATFVARKQGFDAPGASDFTGQVHTIDIGVPRTLIDAYRVVKDNRA